MLQGSGALEYDMDNFLRKTPTMYAPTMYDATCLARLMWTCRMCEELCYDLKYHLRVTFNHTIKT